MPLDPNVAPVIEALGGPSEAAEFLGCLKSTFYSWKRVPRWYLKQISKKTGIPVSELRPGLVLPTKRRKPHV